MSLRQTLRSWHVVAAICLLLTASSLLGAPTTQDQAQKVVKGWLRAHPRPLAARLGVPAKAVDTYFDERQQPVYFIVNLQPSGFVIVPADDEAEPIVGFTPEGSYDPSAENPLGALVGRDIPGRIALIRGMKANQALPPLLQPLNPAATKWHALISLAQQNSLMTHVADLDDNEVRVSPLVQSQWDQLTVCGSNCYNFYTPNNYLCGCPATAMAQLMRFHQHPSVGVGTATYTITVDGTSQSWALRGGNGSGGPYSWSDMVLVPGCSTTLAQRQAIGALCADAGVAINSFYTSWGSGIYTANQVEMARSLRDPARFRYANAIQGSNGQLLNIGAGLNGMINPNLDAGYPVLLCISGASSGHAVVCDGYGFNASTLYHHLNMGWSGEDDLWYQLPAIDPPIKGYTFSSVVGCTYNVYVSGSGEIVSGRVTDATGNAIPDVQISATRAGGGNYYATTNARGIYALTKVPAESTYVISAAKNGYTFINRSAVTRTSRDSASTSGNVWQVDFVAGASLGSPPQLSNPRVTPDSGITSTVFEFMIDYYDPDGHPPRSDYQLVNISGGYGGLMNLKTGSAANGTYSFTTQLPQGVYAYSFAFVDTSNQGAVTDARNGPTVYASWNSAIHMYIVCPYVSSSLELKYSLSGLGGPWTNIEMTGPDLGHLVVPIGTTVTFNAGVNDPNFLYDSWDAADNGTHWGGVSNTWSVKPIDDHMSLDVTYLYTPQQYTLTGTVLRTDATPVPGGVKLVLSSPEQHLEQVVTNGVWSFAGVLGGVPVTITPSAATYLFTPAQLSYLSLRSDKPDQRLVAYLADFTAPTTSLVSVPQKVGESSAVSFTWSGQDDTTGTGDLLYQYRLDPVDAAGTWSAEAGANTRSYDLANGSYTFWVRAKDQAGNVNQAPVNYSFVVNAAPRVLTAARTSSSVWASRLTLQMPTGASQPTNQFVLLPEHSGITGVDLAPAALHRPGEAAPCGANEIIAAALGVPARITKARIGWLISLPDALSPGQSVQYDIVWGHISYFGWQDEVTLPHDFPDLGENDTLHFSEIVGTSLDDNLTMWRLAMRSVKFSTDAWDMRYVWAMANASSRSGPVVPQEVVRFLAGSTWDGSYAERYNWTSTGGFISSARSSTCSWVEDKSTKTIVGGTNEYHYYERYTIQGYTSTGQVTSTFESPWTEDASIKCPSDLDCNRLWFLRRYRDESNTWGLWVAAHNWDTTPAIPWTKFYSTTGTQSDDPRYFDVKQLGSRVVLLFSHLWETTAGGDDRQQLMYQVRERDGTLHTPSTLLHAPVLDDSVDKDDEYEFLSALTDKEGKVWVSFGHYQSGSGTTRYYTIIGTDGSIWKSPTVTPGERMFRFCDREGYIWATDTDLYILRADDSLVVPPRPPAYLPNQDVGTIAAARWPDGTKYRSYDRWSPHLVQVDVPTGLQVDAIDIIDLNLWANDLHPADLELRKGESVLWSHAGAFTGRATVALSGELVTGANAVTLTQHDLQA